ncbi:molybdate ABC transporter substrate-binding protein [Anaerolineales bacterium HSG6]|nr:molybdate ABC transporter substrate-binding protein [Anaerolineales bacterium HSG6]
MKENLSKSVLITIILGLILIGLTAGCSPAMSADNPTLTVFAAASLNETFTEIATIFEAEHPGTTVLLNFAGSQTLRLQIEQGAPADLFASANHVHVQQLIDQTLIMKPVVFAHNQLAVIVPIANPAQIDCLADLAQPNLKLVLASTQVPAGRYSRELLQQLNHAPELSPTFSEQVLQNLVSEEDSVKGVVSKVQLDEADVGIVYQSDVTPAIADAVQVIPIPDIYNVRAEYPIAQLKNRPFVDDLGTQFIDFVTSTKGQVILAKHGFLP